jgi:hypothetical protein
MKVRLIALCLLSGIAIYGCSKTKNNDVSPTHPFTGAKTAPDNYQKTVSDESTTLIATWKPISGYTSFYDANGVLIGVSAIGASGLSKLQFIDTTKYKETNAEGDSLKGSYIVSKKDTIMYLNFVGDDGYFTYGIDTLIANRLAISQITKSPGGVVFNMNGTTTTAYEYVLHFNFSK